MEAPSIEQHWFSVFCRKYLAELIVSIGGTIAGLVLTGLISGELWASSVNSKFASVDEKITNIRDDFRLQSAHVEKNNDLLSAHGERISALEASRR